MHPEILGIGLAVPENTYTQEQAAKILGYDSEEERGVFLGSQIEQRNFALPLEIAANNKNNDREYINEFYMKEALTLSLKAAEQVLKETHTIRDDVDAIFFATCTNYSCPSLSYYIARDLGLKRNLRHFNIYGMGCHAAVPALEAGYNYITTNPKHKALVILTELYSVTMHPEHSLETAVGDAIFADSSAAFVLGGESSEWNGRATARIKDYEWGLDPDNIAQLGYTFPDGRFRIRLDQQIPTLVAPLMGDVVGRLLEKNELDREDIKAWIVHPGGKRILEKAEKALGLSESDLRFSRKIYSRYGNQASVGVAFVLDEVMRSGQVHNGDHMLLLSMGPGLTAAGMLLQREEIPWQYGGD